MRIAYTIILLFVIGHLNGQDQMADFGAPLEIPLFLSGNFAELRSNHFHTGIDIKTQGVQGQKVLAAEDGFVSRISVSPYGYGLALYLEHENGYTTVYGHLREYDERIADLVSDKQYSTKAFRVDFKPETKLFYKKGELIGLSGNSGGSGGPHLHFEIRRTEDNRALNPLKFGFDIKDDIPPRIRGVRLHPMSDSTLINGQNKSQSFVVHGGEGKYRLKSGTNIEVYGAFGISIHSLDYLNGQPNKCGLYEVHLEVNDETICRQVFDELDFGTTRHINTYKAYDVYKSNGWHYHKSFVEPGNELDIYLPETKNQGTLNFDEVGTHDVRYTVKDAYENISLLTFQIRSLANPNGILPEIKPYDAYFQFNEDNSFVYQNEFEVFIPKGALYNDLKMVFGREMQKTEHLSPRYSLHNGSVPLNDHIKVSIDGKDVPKELRERTIAGRFDSRGRGAYIPGTWNEDRFEFKTKSFGKFVLVADTLKPEVRLISQKPSQISNKTLLRFKVKDDKSGMSKYNAYLDGNWVLTEYEPKKKTLTIVFENADLSQGATTLKLVVVDGAGNNNTLEYNF